MDSYKCPICFEILREPIDLPCSHSLCRECLDCTVSESAIQCPICRFRLSNWLRKAKSTLNLVNQEKWEYIQKNLKSLQIHENLLNDSSATQTYEEPICHQLAKPGELRAEYEKLLARQKMMREEELKSEEEASMALVKQLELEDIDELNTEKANEEQPDSVDSITSEMNSSFQPIMTYPTTPPKHKLLKSPERIWPTRLPLNDKENKKRSVMEEWLNIAPNSKCKKKVSKKNVKRSKAQGVGGRNLRSASARPLRSKTMNQSSFKPYQRDF